MAPVAVKKGRNMERGQAYDALVEAYLRERGRRLKAVTVSGYRYALASFGRVFGDRPMRTMGPGHVEDWLHAMRCAGCTDNTRRDRLSVLKCFTRWATLKRHIVRDPCVDVEPIHVPDAAPRVFEPHEIRAILDACPDARARCIVMLMCQQGLRCVSVSRLRLCDIGRDHMRVSGKGGTEHNLPIVSEMRRALSDYLAVRGHKPGPLISSTTRPGLGLAPSTISDYIRGYIEAAGCKDDAHDGKSAHGLRRSFATHMAAMGADAQDIADGLGHANLANARKYVRANAERLRGAMEGRSYMDAEVVPLEETG